jgi:hypothetical protein
MALLVQDILRSGMTPAELLERHAVHIKPHAGKVSLVYDQILAKDEDPVAQECRGLVLREGSWDIVAFPFRRFFNHGQPAAASLDWATAAFQQKLDGTLIIAYWDGACGTWHVATRSMNEAHGPGHFGKSFRELADQAARDMGHGSLLRLLSKAPKDHTLMFELTAPENRVVCDYAERQLTLIGARSLVTLEEVAPVPLANELGVLSPRTWNFENLDALIDEIRHWDPREYEGIVVCDARFNRIKVKSPQYLVAHHAADSLGASWRSVVEAVASGTVDDIQDMLPPFVRGRVDVAREKLGALCSQTELDWMALRGISDIKEFAEHAKKRRWPAALFALKREKTPSLADFLKATQPKSLVELAGLENEEASP